MVFFIVHQLSDLSKEQVPQKWFNKEAAGCNTKTMYDSVGDDMGNAMKYRKERCVLCAMAKIYPAVGHKINEIEVQ